MPKNRPITLPAMNRPVGSVTPSRYCAIATQPAWMPSPIAFMIRNITSSRVLLEERLSRNVQ